jgi:hypothetical protein
VQDPERISEYTFENVTVAAFMGVSVGLVSPGVALLLPQLHKEADKRAKLRATVADLFIRGRLPERVCRRVSPGCRRIALPARSRFNTMKEHVG